MRVVLATVLATLAIAAGPSVVSSLDQAGQEQRLTPTGQRVLAEVPGAFATDGSVVVPAAGDDTRSWTTVLVPARLQRAPSGLGVRALVAYAELPLRPDAPVWLSAITPADRVYSDVGPVYGACVTVLRGQDVCSGSLLVEHAGRWRILRYGLVVHDLETLEGRLQGLRRDDRGRPVRVILSASPEGVDLLSTEGYHLGSVRADR